jgi:hypothetical protein
VAAPEFCQTDGSGRGCEHKLTMIGTRHDERTNSEGSESNVVAMWAQQQRMGD